MKPIKTLNYSTDKKQTVSFKTKKEADRYAVLSQMQEKGLITDLQTNVTFILIDAVYKTVTEKKIRNGKPTTKKKKICVETPVKFTANFTYKNKKGKLRVEVVRTNYRDDAYTTKRKLIRYLHQITLIEN